MPGLSPAWRFSTIKPATVRKLLYKSFPWSQLFFWSAKAGRDKANPYDTPPDRIRLQDGRPLDHTNARLPQVSDKTSSARRHIKVELCPLQSINHKPKNTARNFHFQWWASNWHDAISILKFIIFYTCQDICFAISVVQCCLGPPQASLETLSSVSLSGCSWVASFMSSSMVKVARPVLLIHKGSVHLFEHALLHELHEY